MLMEQVQSMKGIPISRMRVVLPPDRKIEGAKLEFTLKRLGIFENSHFLFQRILFSRLQPGGIDRICRSRCGNAISIPSLRKVR